MLTTRDSLLRNSTLIMGSTVATSAIGYLYWAVAARTMPAAYVGLASALVSAFTVISVAANLGVGHTFVQHLPGLDVRNWSRAVSTGLAAGCVATATAAIVAVAVLPKLSGEFRAVQRPVTAALLATGAVTVTASTLLDFVFVAQRASGGMLTRNLGFAVGKLVLLGALVAVGRASADAVLATWVMTSIVVSAVTVVAMLPRLRPGMRFTLDGAGRELRRLRRSLVGHHLINLTQTLPGFVLPVLVLARLGAQASAYFYLTWMVASALYFVSPAVASALFAERSHGARPGSVRRAALLVAGILAVPALSLLVAPAPLLALFGDRYAERGAGLLVVLVLAAVPDAVTNVAVAYWRSEGRLRRCAVMNAVMATVGLAGSWMLLPGLGIRGAGVAWLAGQTVGAVLVAGHLVLRRRT